VGQAEGVGPYHANCSWPTGEVEGEVTPSCGFAAVVGEEAQGYTESSNPSSAGSRDISDLVYILTEPVISLLFDTGDSGRGSVVQLRGR